LNLRRSLFSTLFAFGCLVTSAAHAEVSTQEKALASRLFDHASALMASGQPNAACAKYAESKRLDPQLGTLLYLGECYAKVGKSASAWVSFKEAADIAAQRGDSRAPKIRERLANIEKGLCNLVIVVADSEPATLEVRQDGALVGRAGWGTPIPIDPGEHKITATAPGAAPREVLTTVADSARTITVTLPAIEYLPAPAPPSGGNGDVGPTAKTPPLPPPDQRSWVGKHRQALALAVGGVGVAGLGVGAAFGLMVKPTYDKSAADCAGDVCGPSGHDYRQSAFGKAMVSNVAFGVGAAALLGGAVLWLTAPKQPDPERRALLIAPSVGSNLAMIELQRAW
jgi:serine/threonine-protein kinase